MGTGKARGPERGQGALGERTPVDQNDKRQPSAPRFRRAGRVRAGICPAGAGYGSIAFVVTVVVLALSLGWCFTRLKGPDRVIGSQLRAPR